MAVAKKDEMKFEDKIKKLESIVSELESGEVDLDDAISKYTEAMKLSKECSLKLEEVTEKVNKILMDNGKLEDFEVSEQLVISGWKFFLVICFIKNISFFYR